MRTHLAVFAFLAVTSAAAGARADEAIQYVGIHPISAEYGGGFCYIEFPHVHVYAPTRPDVLYRRHDGEGYHFVGDPVPYGYEGPKQAYYGPHPIYVDGDMGDPEWCYLEGPHYHPYAPSPQARFKLKGGVYFFAGDLPRVYTEARPRYAKINAIYRPFHYQRPVVVVSPPPEYRGPVYVEDAPPPVVMVRSEPSPVVVVPSAPVIGVGVGVHAEAGIGFHAGIGAGVVIGSPQPEVVHVVRPAQTVVVHERPVEVIEVGGPRYKYKEKEWHEHDRGWHGKGHERRGWH